MRLIDGDALVEKFNEKVDMAECLVDARTVERFATFCALADAVEEMPTADAAPVVHGRWVFGKDLPDSFGSMSKNKYHLYCSECRNQAFNNSTDNDCDFDMDTPFCPWCGAKMDGGVDNG